MSVHTHIQLDIEERCHCGHARAEHHHLHIKTARHTYCREGYGACTRAECNCKRFRWLESARISREETKSSAEEEE
jgi:hypothetical protein